jgi:RHH-type transcriptional regulator, rel operon repressor / antitoxin RelB
VNSKAVKSLDAAAGRLKRTLADIIRRAIEYYLEDVDDLSRALDALRDPADPVSDWDSVKRDLLAKN